MIFLYAFLFHGAREHFATAWHNVNLDHGRPVAFLLFVCACISYFPLRTVFGGGPNWVDRL